MFPKRSFSLLLLLFLYQDTIDYGRHCYVFCWWNRMIQNIFWAVRCFKFWNVIFHCTTKCFIRRSNDYKLYLFASTKVSAVIMSQKSMLYYLLRTFSKNWNKANVNPTYDAFMNFNSCSCFKKLNQLQTNSIFQWWFIIY